MILRVGNRKHSEIGLGTHQLHQSLPISQFCEFDAVAPVCVYWYCPNFGEAVVFATCKAQTHMCMYCTYSMTYEYRMKCTLLPWSLLWSTIDKCCKSIALIYYTGSVYLINAALGLDCCMHRNFFCSIGSSVLDSV